MSAKPPKLGHVAALDGVRGLAFLAVLSAHLHPWPGLAGGQVAMAAFFSLSGFLITALVVTERDRTGRISLRDFYARRALRLLPALFAMLVIWLGLVVAFGSHPWMSTVPGSSGGGRVAVGVGVQGVVVAAGYLTNWWTAFHLFTGYVPLGHLWSLAVEEQFYLVWAPVLAILYRWGHRLALPVVYGLSALSLAEPLWFWTPTPTHDRIYFGTDTRAGALLLGAAVGIHWSRGHLGWLRRPGMGVAVLAGVAMLALAATGLDHGTQEWAWYPGWAAAAVGSALVIAGVVMRPAGLGGRLLSHPALAYVGRRSYALYLWHYLFATWFNSLGLAGDLLTVGCSFAAAEVSWHLLERPALSLKHRVTPDPERRRLARSDRVRTPRSDFLIPAT